MNITESQTTVATGAEVKSFLRGLGHKTVRVRSSAGKGRWITAWIPSDNSNPLVLRYTEQPFSVELRLAAVGMVYGDNAKDAAQRVEAGQRYGNIEMYSIALPAGDWEYLLGDVVGGAK